MYDVFRIAKEKLLQFQNESIDLTVFQTYPWVNFLEKNQNIEIVVLELKKDDKTQCFFVGGITKKFGIKILGSPFEGWLTCEMGFVKVADFDLNEALQSIKQYAFKTLGCFMIQITDYNINYCEALNISKCKLSKTKFLKIELNKPDEKIIEAFSKNGRRDVRAALRKGATFKKVDFDYGFADRYYKQLEYVFDKQNLKPFYSKQKVYDLVDAFKAYPEMVGCFEAFDEENESIATVFSFGFGKRAYFVGAASSKDGLNLLPNEGLFWNFVTYWNSRGIKDLDLVGMRKYKLKYSPQLIDVPVIVLEKIRGIYFLKEFAKKCIKLYRNLKVKFK